MATRFYLINSPPEFTPTVLGGWNVAPSSHPVRLFDTVKVNSGFSSYGASELPFAGSNHRVLLLRGVTKKLRAQTLSGTYNLVLGLQTFNPATSYFLSIQIFVLAGDTNTFRGSTGAFENAPANVWTTTAKGIPVSFDLIISSINVQAGDRLVFEIGYKTDASVDPSNPGTIYYGTNALSADLTASSLQVTTLAGSITFSQDIIFDSQTTSDISHVIQQVASPGSLAPSHLAHVIEQISSPAPSEIARLSHSVVQVAQTPGPSVSALSHVIIQVVQPPPIPLSDTSGLYFLDPLKGLPHDSLYNSQELKIPDPTIRTALLGE